MAKKYDAIIIGGGHNGLTCGNYLARAGLKTIVLERRSVIGGAAVTEEIVPGFKFSVFSYGFAHCYPKVMHDLELTKFGLETVPLGDLFAPINDKDFLIQSKNVKETQKYFSRFSHKDSVIYPKFLEHFAETAKIIKALMIETPIDPVKRSWRSYKENMTFLWKYRNIGDHFYRIADIFSKSADEFLSDWFESSEIRALFAYNSGVGNMIGPKSPGSAWATLYSIFGAFQDEFPTGHVIGGMGNVTKAMVESGCRFGLEVMSDSEVTRVLIKNGRCTGVITSDGTEYSSSIIVSNAHCKPLFEDLVGEEHVPADFMRDIQSFKTFSSAWKMNIACDAPPLFSAFEKEKGVLDFPSFVHIGPDIDYLERAYDDAKYGWYSTKPWMTVATPTFRDLTMAPEGKHVVSLYGGHAPYELKGAKWDDERDQFIKTVLNVMDQFAPSFSSSIIDMQVLLPSDIERILRIPNGHIFHGEMSVDQMFFQRPAPHYSDYRTPIHGLYQCGAFCHPGGGVTAIPGHNAAREILKDQGK